MISIGADKEVLAITCKQEKLYPDQTEEKKRLKEVRTKIEKETQVEKSQLKDTTSTSTRNYVKQNIIQQILQTEVSIKINDLLLTMP